MQPIWSQRSLKTNRTFFVCVWDSMFGRPLFAVQWHVPKFHWACCLITSNNLKFTRKINVIDLNYVMQVLKLLRRQNSTKFSLAGSSVKMWKFCRRFGNYPRFHLQEMRESCITFKPWRHCPPEKILSKYVFQSRPGSVVVIATGYGLNGQGIESRWGRNFPHLSRLAPGTTQPPVQWLPGLSRG